MAAEEESGATALDGVFAPSRGDGVLLHHDGAARARACSIAEFLAEDGRREPIVIDSWTEHGDGRIEASGSSSSFSAELLLAAPGGDPPMRQARVRIRCEADGELRGGFRVRYRLAASDDPRWLIPGLFYGENRPEDSPRRFPRFTTDHPDPQALESDHWGFRVDRAASPLVLARDGAGAVALLTSEIGPFGENGLAFSYEDGAPVLALDFPFREEPVSYYGSGEPQAAVLPAVGIGPGQLVELAYSVAFLASDRHSYAGLLRRLTSERAGGRAPVAWVSIEEAAELAAWGLYRWHYRADPAVLLETAAFDREALGERGDRAAMHVSWVSGTPYAYALLRHARRLAKADYLAAATAVLDHVCDNLTPGGTFFGQWKESGGWTYGWTPEHGRLHSRTLADATLFVLRALLHERRAGSWHPSWESAVRSNLATAAATQRFDGALGAAHHQDDGRVLDWRGSAGLAWVAPLAEAAVALDEPSLLDSARRAGAYYAEFVEREYLHGAPEDVDLAPTSEDGYLAVISYLALERADPRGGWLGLAARSADWMLSFRYTYDVSFSEQTLLGRYRFSTLGADQASPSNQHLHAFGLVCLAEMGELSAALGDPYYRERARETLACFRQFIARQDGDFDAYRGMASERYYQTTCFQAKGMLLTLSHAWSVGVLLLACEEAIDSGEDWEEAPGSPGGLDQPAALTSRQP